MDSEQVEPFPGRASQLKELRTEVVGGNQRALKEPSSPGSREKLLSQPGPCPPTLKNIIEIHIM